MILINGESMPTFKKVFTAGTSETVLTQMVIQMRGKPGSVIIRNEGTSDLNVFIYTSTELTPQASPSDSPSGWGLVYSFTVSAGLTEVRTIGEGLDKILVTGYGITTSTTGTIWVYKKDD